MSVLLFLILTHGSVYCLMCWLCRIRSATFGYAALLFIVPTYILGNAFHEGSHALGLVLTGGNIEAIRLFPNPFAGEIGAFVRPKGELIGTVQTMVTLLAPYATDSLLLVVFLWLAAACARINKILLAGVVLFVCTRSVLTTGMRIWDMTRSTGDYAMMGSVVSTQVIWILLSATMLLELLLCVWIIIRLRNAISQLNAPTKSV